MFMKEYTLTKRYERHSKLGVMHTYHRKVTVVVLRCDNCGTEFERSRGSMDPKRLSNNYFHVCKDCDAKRFAQKRGVQAKQVWNMSASSSTPIGRL